MTANSTADVGELTAAELSALYRAKRLSPVEATEAALSRIARFNPAVNAYVCVDAGGALAAAKASEARWAKGEPLSPIDGVPSSIKDLTFAKGLPTRKGSFSTDDVPAAEDAPFSARMRAAGAVILGKTATPEFGWKGVTDNPPFGITRNPWNTGRTSGGSSGGAAAAAAASTWGCCTRQRRGRLDPHSLRLLRRLRHQADLSVIPQWPASAMTTLSHLGPVTRTVKDAAMMLNAVARPDPRDWYAGRSPRRLDGRSGCAMAAACSL